MNKQQITQEEFDKKVESIVDYDLCSHFSYLNNPSIDKGQVEDRLKQWTTANLKERYEIK